MKKILIILLSTMMCLNCFTTGVMAEGEEISAEEPAGTEIDPSSETDFYDPLDDAVLHESEEDSISEQTAEEELGSEVTDSNSEDDPTVSEIDQDEAGALFFEEETEDEDESAVLGTPAYETAKKNYEEALAALNECLEKEQIAKANLDNAQANLDVLEEKKRQADSALETAEQNAASAQQALTDANTALTAAQTALTHAEGKNSTAKTAVENAEKAAAEAESAKAEAEQELETALLGHERIVSSPKLVAAQQKVEDARAAVQAAEDVISEGSMRFFKENTPADADDILILYNEISELDYVKQGKRGTVFGDVNDATSLENMKMALQLLKQTNDYRVRDGLTPLKTSDAIMLFSQMQANVSNADLLAEAEETHDFPTLEHNHYLLNKYHVGENLASPAHDYPAEAWYESEKADFEAILTYIEDEETRNHIRDTYFEGNGAFRSDSEESAIFKAAKNAFYNEHGYYPQLGHYANAINSNNQVVGAAWVLYREGQPYYNALYPNQISAIFNPVYTGVDFEYGASLMNFYTFTRNYGNAKFLNEVQTVDEYIAAFNEYYDGVMGAKDTAAANLEAAEAELEAVTAAHTERYTIPEEVSAAEAKLQNAQNALDAANAVLTSANSELTAAELALSEARETLNDAETAAANAGTANTNAASALETARNTANQAGTAAANARQILSDLTAEYQNAVQDSEDARAAVEETKAIMDREDITIFLNRTELTLNKGASESLTASITPEGSSYSIVWSSENDAIASVDQTGKVTGTGKGTVGIKASTPDGGVFAVCTVTVRIPVETVTLNREKLVLAKGETGELTATVLPENVNDRTVIWSTTNPKAVTVTQSGFVTAVDKGKADVVVTTNEGGYTAVCEVEVFIPVGSVSLNKTELNLVKGTSETLTATVLPNDADNREVVWSSDHPAAVTVDQNGKVTAVSKGTAIITAETSNGLKATCTVTVRQPVTGVTLNKSSLNLLKGNSETLIASVTPSDANNQTVRWSSSNAAVASVDQNGFVTAAGKGTAVITATTEDGGKEAKCTVSVTIAVSSVSLNKDVLELTKGASETLTATVLPSGVDQSVTWSSDNANVATVSSSGVVTAVNNGTAHITVTTKDGNNSAVCTVTVTTAITGVTLNKTTLSLNKGASETIIATVLPAGADQSVTWSSDNTNVATVNNGTVTAVGNGTAKITVKTKDGSKSVTCTVTVTTAVTRVTLNKTSLSLNKGTSEKLTATVLPEGADQSVTWSSDNTSVATVNNGTVTAVGNGTAHITAKTKDGTKSASCTVTVGTPVTGLQLNKTGVVLEKGQSMTLTAAVSPSDATNKKVVWTSNNPSIVTVDQNGKITAVGSGTSSVKP